MADIAGLRRLREERFFAGWDESVGPERVTSSETSVRRLIDDLLAHGPDLSEDAARAAVDEFVRRFNALDDDGWIYTIEREDIYEQVGRAIDLRGFEYGEEWGSERDWRARHSEPLKHCSPRSRTCHFPSPRFDRSPPLSARIAAWTPSPAAVGSASACERCS